MQRVRTETAAGLRYDDMISGAINGRLLAQLAAGTGEADVLELGTFTGYSTLWMASAKAGGRVVTVDSNLKYLAIARRCFAASPWQERIESVHSDAMEFLESYTGRPALVYLDADKRRYPEYWERLKPYLDPGAWLVADNVFWKGGAGRTDDAKGAAVARFTEAVFSDPAFTTVLLPVRDGLLLARRTG